MMEKGISKYLIFCLDKHKYALPLSCIERIVRSVEITPLPRAPDVVLGLINHKGRIIPVINIRRRFNYPENEVNLRDKLILLHTHNRVAAFLVNKVQGIIEVAENDVVPPKEIVPGMDYIQGVIRRDEGMILIHQLDRLLSGEEDAQLNKAIKNSSVVPGL
jgi:purine-binding chemotaxis protein CheW